MTEIEMQRARRNYERQTRKSWIERLAAWWGSLKPAGRGARRMRLDRKAEVERRARQTL